MSTPKQCLALLLLCHLCLSLALMARVPLGKAPDEAAHWQYVEYIATQGKLPVFQGTPPPNPGYEFHQPPLYYALCAPLWKLTGPGIQNYACRFVAMLFSLATLMVLWRTVRLLWPQRLDIALMATGFAALSPVHVGVGSSSNNDGPGGFWAATLFGMLAVAATRGWTRRDQVLTGLLGALAVWTKNTSLVVVAVTLAAAFHLDLRARKAAVPGPSGAFLTVAGAFVLAASPLFVRNFVLYGDPLGIKTFSEAASAASPGFVLFNQAGISFIQYWRGMLLCFFSTAWGFWGGPNAAVAQLVPLAPKPLAPGILALMVLFAGGSLTALLGLLRLAQRQPGQPLDQPAESSAKVASGAGIPFLALWWAVGSFLVVMAWANFAYSHFAGGQARYVHVALLPMAIAAAWGWSTFWGRGVKAKLMTWGFATLLAGMNLANILVWRTLD